jgi:multidrug efflux pump subunit AcrA (membrane-fusion protein)
VALLDEEVELATMRAPVSGVVLTPHVEQLAGRALEEGDLLLSIGRTDSLELEFGVAQRDIARVRPGQEIRLRVDAMPQRTFVGWVRSVAPVPADSAAEVRYPVRAVVPNPDGALKPSMAAYVRVLTDPASAGTRLLRAPVRWARLFWWRIWS